MCGILVVSKREESRPLQQEGGLHDESGYEDSGYILLSVG
jgi:hypothetical protein